MVKDEWHTNVYARNCPVKHRIQIGKSSNFLDGHDQIENVCEICAQHFGILLYNSNANVEHTGMDTKNLWSPFILSIPKRFFSLSSVLLYPPPSSRTLLACMCVCILSTSCAPCKFYAEMHYIYISGDVNP